MDRSLLEALGRRVRVGMVGGGADSVIGRTHLTAMRTDGFCDFVAGAMSIDPKIAEASGRQELLAPERIYTDWRDMAEKEAARPDRVDVVVVATPPRLHLPVARAFLERGFDVMCEKPMTADLAEARELAALVARTGRLFCLTHCYTGYPMVRQARAMIEAGAIGRVRLIEAEFSVGAPALVVEPDDPAKRHWRFRPEQSGKSGLLGECGSHAYHMAGYLTGLRATQVSALMATFADRREVYDNCYITARFGAHVQGRLWTSYVAAGNDHGLTMKIYGESGNFTWWQEDGDILWHTPLGGPSMRLAHGYDGYADATESATRIRAGHPEGYLMAFANLYQEFAQAIIARNLGRDPRPYLAPLPTVAEGLAGMALIEAATQSQDRDGAWVKVAG